MVKKYAFLLHLLVTFVEVWHANISYTLAILR